MRLELRHTKYRDLIRQLGNLKAYTISTGYSAYWYSTLGEAYTAALTRHRGRVEDYQRECPGKQIARNAVTFLEDMGAP